MSNTDACSEKICLVSHSQLPFSCPSLDQKVWNAHPKVFLALEKEGSAVCPYCSTRYILEDN